MSAGTTCTQSFLIPDQILDLEPSQESVWSSSTGQCRGSKQRQQLVRKSCKGFSTERWFWWQVCDKIPALSWVDEARLFLNTVKNPIAAVVMRSLPEEPLKKGRAAFSNVSVVKKKKSAPATSRRFTSTASCQDFHLAVHRYQNWRSVATYGDLELTSSQDLHSVCIWSLPMVTTLKAYYFSASPPKLPHHMDFLMSNTR